MNNKQRSMPFLRWLSCGVRLLIRTKGIFVECTRVLLCFVFGSCFDFHAYFSLRFVVGSVKARTFPHSTLTVSHIMYMIITDFSSNECIFGKTKILFWVKFIHGIWICSRFWKPVHFFLLNGCCLLFTLRFLAGFIFRYCLVVDGVTCKHIWMNIECIHVSNSSFDPSTNFLEICIVGFGLLYSFFIVEKMKNLCVCR